MGQKGKLNYQYAIIYKVTVTKLYNQQQFQSNWIMNSSDEATGLISMIRKTITSFRKMLQNAN